MAAFQSAIDAHHGQRRDADAVPYVVHPLEVAAMLEVHGYDDRVTAAAVLHDTLEDTQLTADELRERFGGEVADLVVVLSDDEHIGDEPERKAALRDQVGRAEGEAAAVFAADKVSKVRELRIRLSREPNQARDKDIRLKLDHYRHSLLMLEQSLGAHPLVRAFRFELEALHMLPPHGRPLPR
jgi:(p)ppGpp synthase/HD superfamily hydrolase